MSLEPTPIERQTSLVANPNQLEQAREIEPIEMPKNSAIGFINAFFAVVTGFALIGTSGG
jgi:hypothetical protein